MDCIQYLEVTLVIILQLKLFFQIAAHFYSHTNFLISTGRPKSHYTVFISMLSFKTCKGHNLTKVFLDTQIDMHEDFIRYFISRCSLSFINSDELPMTG